MVTKRDLVVATTRHHRAGIKNNQGRGRSYRVLVTFYYSSTVMQNYAAILLAELLYCTLLAMSIQWLRVVHTDWQRFLFSLMLGEKLTDITGLPRALDVRLLNRKFSFN